MRKICIEAANPDNEMQIRSIIDLFSTNFSRSFPAEGVYDPQFWRNHIGSRFISLLGRENERKVVGHFALQPERCNKRHVQFSLPIFDISNRNSAFGFCTEIEKQICSLAKRQNWEMLYSFAFSNMPYLQEIISDVLHTEVTAIWPGCLSAETLRPVTARAGSEPGRGHLLVTHRLMTDQRNHKRHLFVPENHLDICKWLYNPLALKRDFHTSFNGDFSDLEGLPADARAAETHSFPRSDVSLTFVHPSLISSPDSLWHSLNSNRITSRFLLIDLHDPACPEFCKDVENLGFCFAGIMPLLKRRDSIVFFKDNDVPLEDELLYSKRAKTLAKYIEECRSSIQPHPSISEIESYLPHQEEEL